MVKYHVSSNASPVSSTKSTCTFASFGFTLRRRLYTGINTGSIPEVVCVIKLVVPVGAMVKQAMFLLPYFFISSYSSGSASFKRFDERVVRFHVLRR